MCDYILQIKDRNALCRYIAFLEECEFEGEIFVGMKMMDAKDILLICDKLINEIYLKVRSGNKLEIEKYLRRNGLLKNF